MRQLRERRGIAYQFPSSPWAGTLDRYKGLSSGVHSVKHRDGSVGSVVANHHGGGGISVTITTLLVGMYVVYVRIV